MPLRSCLRYALACLVASLPSRFGVYLLVAGPSHVFASPCLCLAMPCHALPCCAPASPRSAIPLPCCAKAVHYGTLLCQCLARLCCAIALRCNSFAYPLVSTQFRFRSNPSSALAVPVDATLRLCLQCFSDAGRGYANQCRCNSHRYISSLFLCRSILCVAYAAHRVSSPSLIGAYPRPIKSYRLPGLSILRFASASQSATIHFRSGA